MAQTYTRWSFTTGITGTLYSPALDSSFANPTFVFVFPNGDYFSQTGAQADNSTYTQQAGFTLYVINPTDLLASELYLEDNGEFFNAADESIVWTRTALEQGVYHYTVTNGSDSELQYIILMPDVEAAISTLAQKLLDSQCNCQMNRSVMDNFVKAKALQQLIYAKVAEHGNAMDSAFLTEINTDVTVLQDFLQGTDDMCGC